MKIPNKVKICGLTYQIIKDKNLHRDAGFQGEHICKELVIKIQDGGYAKEKIEQTFFHEIVHAINTHYNNDELTEEQVDRIGNGIYAFLKDNNLLRGQDG